MTPNDSTAGSRRALILSFSDIETDPRVRRQIDWLAGGGWVIDTFGLGDHPTSEVSDHFPMAAPRRWLQTRIGTLLSHRGLPGRTRFRLLVADRAPEQMRERLRNGDYALVVFNEFEFTPWVADRRDFTPAALRGMLHLDLHEYRNPSARRRTLGGWLTSNHYRWVRKHIGATQFTSRTAVNSQIGRLYSDEFGFPEPVPVRNVPSATPQTPSPVDPRRVRMLFHGMLSWQRGFAEILKAMESLPERFEMTFMVMPNPERLKVLNETIQAHPARDRIRIVPPSPMREIASRINHYDLEIIFYRPLEHNLLYALPNKFFEAVQGRLGLVVGESPAMAELIRKYGNGVIVDGFEAGDLERTLRTLTPKQLIAFKEASHVAAAELNAEREGRVFLGALEQSTEIRA